MREPTRLICTGCGARTDFLAGNPEICVHCGGALRKPGQLDRLVDGLLAAPSGYVSPAFHRHLQLVQELWTENGRDQELYATLRPKMSLSKFTGLVTDLVCRGLEEGWIVLHLPPSPSNNDGAYRIEFRDSNRFIDELGAMFPHRR